MGKTLFPEFRLLIGIKSGKGGGEGRAGRTGGDCAVTVLYSKGRGKEGHMM